MCVVFLFSFLQYLSSAIFRAVLFDLASCRMGLQGGEKVAKDYSRSNYIVASRKYVFVIVFNNLFTRPDKTKSYTSKCFYVKTSPKIIGR